MLTKPGCQINPDSVLQRFLCWLIGCCPEQTMKDTPERVVNKDHPLHGKAANEQSR